MAITTRSRPPLVGLSKIALLLASNIPRLHSHPLLSSGGVDGGVRAKEHGGEGLKTADFWINVGVAFMLVIAGGLFAGLTLGLMGQDEIYLQVIEQSGEGAERKHAGRVLRLLKRGKHWVLVTLLLSNVITNETLPIVLDRSLGGGWPAVLSSTVLIVIFGEIIPQSVCVRYGLCIGSYLSPFVLGLMYIMYPVAYPTALLLDYILGEDHGTVYKKAGLKTLVTLHKNLGPSPSERLNQDEVTIISAVLDLKDKPVGSIMTPIKDVFTMSSDTVLDEETMDRILSAGYSRIPIHAPGEPENFVGMLLVKILITYDPEDGKRVGEFPLATLPETRAETSCLDIVNFFQEGKSHMVLVSEAPGENHGALGVVTLEDVIEELIGEEIIDESDVFIDVHKAIRRINPSPLSKRSISSHFQHHHHHHLLQPNATTTTTTGVSHDHHHPSQQHNDKNPAGADFCDDRDDIHPPGRGSRQTSRAGIPDDVLPQFKFLGPANKAGDPKQTKYKTVKIKPANQDEAIKVHSLPGEGLGQTIQSEGLHIDNHRPGDNTAAMSDSAPVHKKPNSKADYGTNASGNGYNDKNGKREVGRTNTLGIKRIAKSGSLVERVEHVGGVPKTVIETTANSDDEGSVSSKKSRGSGRSGRSGGEDGERKPLLG